MKSNIELADKFIEDLATGVVESRITELRKLYKDKDWKTHITDGIADFGVLMTRYRMERDAVKKEQAAIVIVDKILTYRTLGLYANNPKEERLELFRTENEALRRENEDMKGQLAGAMETIKKLHAEVVGKGGIG